MYFDLNENNNMTNKNVQDAAITVIRKEEWSQINGLAST